MNDKQRPKKQMPVSPGRPKGVPNKTTAMLKEAILLAAAEVGDEDHDGQGLNGYLKNLARIEPKSYAGLLGRVIPLQVTGEDGGALVVEIRRFAD